MSSILFERKCVTILIVVDLESLSKGYVKNKRQPNKKQNEHFFFFF